ncbi:MAG TPA: SBBP repeat-containing protein [Candidatus Kapabacteria bacterium]|nr:SBBP repeat-containing protein [Candidatus Kapabacteria bacterium]HPO63096.1 SBBP repeat-containing protein [Candidatus Kapabacteria bacterium]
MKKFVFIIISLLFSIELFSQDKVSGFIENKGQWDSSILFIARTNNANVYITNNCIKFETYSINVNNKQLENYKIFEKDLSVINVGSIKANKKSDYYLNYLIGNDKSKWVWNVHSYSELELYNTKDNTSLKLTVNQNNSLNISVTSKEKNFIQKKEQDELQSIIYSSFLGGANYDVAETVKLTKNNEIVVAGYTFSNNFPISDSAYQKEMKYLTTALPDVFVSKFDSSGENLIFSTYIGGAVDDYAKSIAIDENEDIYVTGYTSGTTTFPTTAGAYSTKSKGGFDCFVLKLKKDGTNLIFSTFIGGVKDDYAQAIGIDTFGNPYITGYTYLGSDFPVTENAFQKTNLGEFDVFLSKFNTNGSQLLFSTLLGGNSEEFGQTVYVLNEQNVYLSGFTRSSDFPVTENAYDKTYNDTSTIKSITSDVFLSKINSISGTLDYSSYIGAAAKDGSYILRLDNENNIILAGVSESADFPVTPESYDTSYNNIDGQLGPGDGILFKFNQAADSLLFSTYLGGTNADRIYDLVLDSINNIYAIGTTSSRDFPTTINLDTAFIKDKENVSNAFISKFSSNGDSLYFSSYLGGSFSDIGKAVALIKENQIVAVGTTNSPDFPITPNGFDTTYNDEALSDCFLSILTTLNFTVSAGADVEICRTKGVFIGNEAQNGYGTVTYSWQPTAGLSNPNKARPFAEPDTTTTYTITAKDEKNNIVSSQITVRVKPSPIAFFKGPKFVFPNTKHSYLASVTNPNWQYYWEAVGGVVIQGQGTINPVVLWNDAATAVLSLIVTNEYGCRDTSNALEMKIGTYFKPVIFYDGLTIFCERDSVILNAGFPYKEYNWSNGVTTQFDTIRMGGKYWVEITDSLGNIGVSDTLDFFFSPAPDTPVVVYEKPYLICVNKEAYYQWYINGNPLDNANNDTLIPTIDGDYFVEVKNVFNCKNYSKNIYVIVSSVPEKKAGKFSIFPNPTENKINIYCFDALEGLIDMKIFDIYSNEVFEKKNIEVTQNNIYSVDIKDIAVGVYILQIYNNNQIYYFRFIKL